MTYLFIYLFPWLLFFPIVFGIAVFGYAFAHAIVSMFLSAVGSAFSRFINWTAGPQ